MDPLEESVVRYMVRKGYTHKAISDYYRNLYPDRRGFSTRNVRRFCKIRGITRISDNEVATFVGSFIALYGHRYGRSLMQGSIRSMLGISSGVVSQRRVAKALQRIAPHAYESRALDIYERTNPVLYFAPYFGYKVHVDQNEKIAQGFGCTHVALIDGYSRMICGYSSMEVKNPILIYEFVFRRAIIQYGLWNQLRIDHGQEFVLCIFAQDLLKTYR